VADYKRLLATVREFTKTARAAAGSSNKIGGIVNQTIALLGTGQKNKAVSTVEAALAINSNNPDLLMLKGRCLREDDPSAAATAFGASYKCGQRKALLFDMWYETFLLQQQYPGALDVANLAIDGGQDFARWLSLRARALVQLGFLRGQDGNVTEAVDMLRRAASDMWSVVNTHRGQGQADEELADIFAVNDEAWKLARSMGGLEAELLVFDTVRGAIELGDLRGKNAERLLEATKALIQEVDFTSDTAQSRAGKTRISDAIRVLKYGVEQPPIPASARVTFRRVIDSLHGLWVSE
jgi:Flp pilus assembly protein TadD